MPKENFDALFNLLVTNTPLSVKDKNLISEKLKSKPELTAHFLFECTLLRSNEIEAIINKLINLGAFNEITINQSVTKKVVNTQLTYSVSYLLLSNLEGREILRKNTTLCALIGEKLSPDLLNQFVGDTHEGTLYYLLTDEIGKTILNEYPALKDKIDKNLLSRQITLGPHRENCLQDLYDKMFSLPAPSMRL